ncbi:MAG: hypothetical protein AB7G47_20055 [Mycolicibacterium sp.]|uniref:hypothetical protein n=1 Tax=Mycolicibacterium sp. TaxID=2320850 RepID=UPI003D12B765
MSPAPIPYQQNAIEGLLKASGRTSEAVNIRNGFVQLGDQRHPVPGPLCKIVRDRDARALDLFLLHRTLASAEPWATRPLTSAVWARMLGIESDRDHGATVVSRTWRRLDEKYGLIARGKKGRKAVYTSLREDGSREEYTAPSGRDVDNRYFQLPFAYWNDDNAWYLNLTLPGKAMLLIASSLKPGFILPTERAPDWYGVSTETAQRGLKELRDVGLITRNTVLKETALETVPLTQEHHYTLVAPFGRNVKRRLSLVPKSVSA